MRLFYFIIVPLIWEGVNLITSPVTVKNNDTPKRAKNAGKRTMSDDNDHKQSEVSTDNVLDSIIIAIDAGNHKNMDARARAKKSDTVDYFIKSLGDLIKNSVDNPVYNKRAIAKAEEYDIKSTLVQLRGDKPSLMLNLHSEAIVNGLKDMLKSKVAEVLLEKMSEDAGFFLPLADE